MRELQQRLADEGWIDPWLDEKKLRPGEDWRVSIAEAVETSDLVIICLSNNAVVKEGFVQKELRYAQEIALEKPDGTIFLIPLRLEACDVPRGLRFFQWADYFGEKKEENYIGLLDSFSIRRQQIIRREQERALREAEEKEKREKEEKARREVEELTKREAEELARRRALEIALKEEEERAHIFALEKAKKEVFEKTLEDARERARLEAELYAQKEIKEKKYKGSLINFAPASFLAIVSLLFVGLVCGISLVGLGQMGIGPFAKTATPTNFPFTPTNIPPTSTNFPSTPTTLSVSDNFDDTSFNGSFNKNLWEYWYGYTSIAQENGVLAISNATQETMLISKKFSSFSLNAPITYEVNMKLSSTAHTGAVDMKIGTDISGGHWVTECNLSASASDSMALAYCWAGTDKGGEYSPQSKNVNFDTWHTFRIEIDPDTMKITYYIDNDMVGSYTPDKADELRKSRYYAVLGVHSVTSSITGYIDDVKIEMK